MSILKAKMMDLVVPAPVASEGTEYGRPFEHGKFVIFRGIWWSAGECRRVLLFGTSFADLCRSDEMKILS